MNKYDIENLYKKAKEKSLKHSKNIDFIGLNILSDNKIELKIYTTPDETNFNFIEKNPIIYYAISEDLIRCQCDAFSNKSQMRSYFALKNRTDKNILNLLKRIEDEYCYIKENSNEIKSISLMKITDEYNMKLASLHMIGIKKNKDNIIINFEWLLRKMKNSNNPGKNYEYNDDYYLNFIENLCINQLTILSKYVRQYFMEYIQKQNFHLWLVAVDYYSNGRKKYKLYIKGKHCIDDSFLYSFCKIDSNSLKLLNQVKEFIMFHEELQLYGFALCLDNHFEHSINFYFIDTR